MFAVFPQPVLIMLIRALKGNPYLVNWFNPSISLVHGLVSVTDKCNMISEASPRLLLADAEGTAEQRDEPPQISAASVSAAAREPPAAVNLWGLARRVEREHPE